MPMPRPARPEAYEGFVVLGYVLARADTTFSFGGESVRGDNLQLWADLAPNLC